MKRIFGLGRFRQIGPLVALLAVLSGCGGSSPSGSPGASSGQPGGQSSGSCPLTEGDTRDLKSVAHFFHRLKTECRLSDAEIEAKIDSL